MSRVGVVIRNKRVMAFIGRLDFRGSPKDKGAGGGLTGERQVGHTWGLAKRRKGAPREVSWAWEEGLAINWSRAHESSFVI